MPPTLPPTHHNQNTANTNTNMTATFRTNTAIPGQREARADEDEGATHIEGGSDEDEEAEQQGEEGSLYKGDARLTELEAQVLDEWVRLRRNFDMLSNQLATLAADPATNISDTLRLLERKTALVHTALKSSVYSIVLSAQEG